MARHLVERVIAHEDRPFDAAWMTETFESFWTTLGHPAFALTNLMLEPMTPAGRLLLIAQYGSDGRDRNGARDGRQALADWFADGFAEPTKVLPALTDVATARRVIGDTLGGFWGRPVAAGAVGIAWRQLRQALGRSPGHPGTSA
jgi:hypothetical protein